MISTADEIERSERHDGRYLDRPARWKTDGRDSAVAAEEIRDTRRAIAWNMNSVGNDARVALSAEEDGEALSNRVFESLHEAMQAHGGLNGLFQELRRQVILYADSRRTGTREQLIGKLRVVKSSLRGIFAAKNRPEERIGSNEKGLFQEEILSNLWQRLEKDERGLQGFFFWLRTKYIHWLVITLGTQKAAATTAKVSPQVINDAWRREDWHRTPKEEDGGRLTTDSFAEPHPSAAFGEVDERALDTCVFEMLDRALNKLGGMKKDMDFFGLRISLIAHAYRQRKHCPNPTNKHLISQLKIAEVLFYNALKRSRGADGGSEGSDEVPKNDTFEEPLLSALLERMRRQGQGLTRGFFVRLRRDFIAWTVDIYGKSAAIERLNVPSETIRKAMRRRMSPDQTTPGERRIDDQRQENVAEKNTAPDPSGADDRRRNADPRTTAVMEPTDNDAADASAEPVDGEQDAIDKMGIVIQERIPGNDAREMTDRRVQDPLETYLLEINETALLSAADEVGLAEKIAKGDMDAKDRLIRANLRLVVNIAKGFAGQSLSLGDLIEEGNLGLIRATKDFDPLRYGTRFSTYASYWIKERIKEALRRELRPVDIPNWAITKTNKWRQAKDRLRNERGTDPSNDEIAAAIGVTNPKKVRSILHALKILDGSEAQECVDEADDGKGGMDLQTLAAQDGDPAALVSQQELIEKALEQTNHLDPREADVLRARFGLGGEEPHTLKEIGEKLSLTRERVRQIEREALAKLREAIDECPCA